MNKPTDILTEAELKQRKDYSRIMLAFKGGAMLFVKACGCYIIEQTGQEPFWTFNESQAVERWNNISKKEF